MIGLLIEMDEKKLNNNIDSSRIFTKRQVENLLTAAMGKTLLEVDSRQLFIQFAEKSKVTGIAGDIVEQSVLGCKPDNRQDIDILIDNVGYEVKTTGMVVPKDTNSPYYYECKEPVSITAVSIQKIVNEEFETSNFWHKLEHLLWVYYWYKSDVTVKLEGYKMFPLLNFQLFEFDDTDRLRLKHDWLLVRDFLISIHSDYSTSDERKRQYPRLSSELRGVLLVIDTAPKYPNPPRFRLKRSFATEVAATLFSKVRRRPLVKLSSPIMDYDDIDLKCQKLNQMYVGKTFSDIAASLCISISSMKSQKHRLDADSVMEEVAVKNFAELVVLKMFESNANSLNDIEDFVKIGLIAKSLPLKANGMPKESMKLFTPNFEKWMKESSFENSFLHDYFMEHQFLFIVYQYDADGIRFKGFKRVVIPDTFIFNDVKKFWIDVRSLILEKRLRIEKRFKKDGTPIMNKSGEQSEAPNFPKEKEYNVFMRGSTSESIEKRKTLVINDLRMIPQEIWLSKRATLFLYQNSK